MSEKVAVINEVHSVAIRIQAWMLTQLGYKVFVAGGSFQGIVENYHNSNQAIPELSGTMEFAGMPQDALFLDTHPKTISRLRERGWNGPILIVWQMPVGPDWVKENFKPIGKCGSLAWSAAVGRVLREMNVCPSDYFWPPYYGPLDRTPRESFEPFLMTVVENAAGWSNVGVLEQLKNDSRTRLELYGGGPPDWSRKIPQRELFARLRKCLAMYHLKPFDTPGLAVMEAALQAVPIIFPYDWLRCTETEFFKDGESCIVVETKAELVIGLFEKLRNVELNRRIGLAGRQKIVEATDWTVNGPRMERLINQIRML